MPPRPSARPLTLHVSALSNAEYRAYTASLAEAIAPMPDLPWEELAIGVREARGWIKGRYGIDGPLIDQILRYFCPDLDPQDTLSAGQFFAAIRLVSHAQNGAVVCEDLVFVQANPELERAPSPTKSRTTTPKSAPPPPPRPPNSSPEVGHATPSLPPRPAPHAPSPNPFTRATRPDSLPPPFRPEKDPPEDAFPSSSNPFRRASNPNPPAPSLSSASSTSSSPANPRQHSSPPLPPRKPVTTLLPPPRHASLAFRASPRPSILPQSPAYASPFPTPPIKPPKPPQATSPLIKQSLEAAKGAQSKKEELENLKRQRRLEVIKKSVVVGGGAGVYSRGSGESTPELETQDAARGHVRPPSPPQSFYDVARARVGPSSRTPSPPLDDEHALQQQQHAHTNTDPTSSTTAATFAQAGALDFPFSPISPTNPRRTRSLHQPRTSDGGGVPPPAPPPPRRRPESAEVPVQAPQYHGYGHSSNGSSVQNPSPLSRHLSLTSDTLHRAFEGLRPGAGFESARVRAEGRIWPGGYVKGLKGGGERLVGVNGADGFGQDGGGDDGDGEVGFERDAMKVPVDIGEGWRTLA